jgi:hypothetical protein
MTDAVTTAGSLVRYDAACRALAAAKSVDEAKHIRDAAIAMAAYARQAKNRDLEADAVEIRLRATRRLDQMRQAQKQSIGLSVGTKGSRIKGARVDEKPTLASQGIDKNLAHQGRVLGALSDEKFEAVVADARDNVARVVRTVVRQAESQQKRKTYSLETPRAMLPSPTGRKIRVARNASVRQWMLVIGPNISREALKEREMTAREGEAVKWLEVERDDLVDRAAALETEAKALREAAGLVRQRIENEVRNSVGSVAPFTETFDFEADEQTDTELAGLPQTELVDRLLGARNAGGGPLKQVGRGYWGDYSLARYQTFEPNGVPPCWTRTGSPDWLAA